MLQLFLVRHAETDWNAQRRYQGHSDIPLNENGVNHARQLAVRLQHQDIDLVFSSDLKRALQTSQILMGSREIQIQTDPRLRELNFGILEGHTFEEGLARWPDMITAWVQDNNLPPQGGETIDEFNRRVSSFFDEIRQNYAQQKVLIVSHGGPLRVIMQGLLRVTEGSAAVWFNLEHASLTAFQIDDENIIVDRLNDTGHILPDNE
jgi:broad specificity phosphatase PhoE